MPINSAALQSDNVIMALATQDKQIVLLSVKALLGFPSLDLESPITLNSSANLFPLEMFYRARSVPRKQVPCCPQVPRCLLLPNSYTGKTTTAPIKRIVQYEKSCNSRENFPVLYFFTVVTITSGLQLNLVAHVQ